ncbi:hypothetical protein PENTCL1PPCAC_404, partial [Pristionchus entomophagus]
LSDSLIAELHETTQQYGSRPLGVGVVLAGYDTDGPHIVRADPSGDVTEMHGTSIGVGSESVKEYLEENVVKFENGKGILITLQIRLRYCSSIETKQSNRFLNITIAIVGKEMSFKIMENDEV